MSIVISIRNTAFVRCREVVRFSEGPLWEVRLYTFNLAIIVHSYLYPGQAKTSKKPQGIISGVGMLEGNNYNTAHAQSRG